jgi:hypothetical protein
MLWILAGESLSRGKESHALRLSVDLASCWIRSLNAPKQIFVKSLSLLFFIRQTIRAWHHPTSGFPAIPKYLLQVVYSLMSMNSFRGHRVFE